MDNPDFLIVGGGSAGATLASLLSQDPATRVLLIEAGADTPPDAIPADIADTFPSSYLNRDYLWPDLTARRSAAEPPRPFPQARVMGGGSSVMGLWALRGLPSDYEPGARRGADGWGWSDVVRCFRMIERDPDRAPALQSSKRNALSDPPHARGGMAGLRHSDERRRCRPPAADLSTTSTKARWTAFLRCRSARMISAPRARAAI